MSKTSRLVIYLSDIWLVEIDKLVAAGYVKNRQAYVLDAVREKVLPLLQTDKREGDKQQ